MFDGGLRGFCDDVVNTARCIRADVAYEISKIKNQHYDKYGAKEERDGDLE